MDRPTPPSPPDEGSPVQNAQDYWRGHDPIDEDLKKRLVEQVRVVRGTRADGSIDPESPSMVIPLTEDDRHRQLLAALWQIARNLREIQIQLSCNQVAECMHTPSCQLFDPPKKREGGKSS